MADKGRHTKRTKETSDKVYEAISDGNTHKVAAALAGIHVSTFYRWMEDDSEFSDTVRKAEAFSESFHVEQIRKASNSNWTASAWMLERRNNQEWGKKDRLDVTSGDEKIEGFKITLVNPSDPDDS